MTFCIGIISLPTGNSESVLGTCDASELEPELTYIGGGDGRLGRPANGACTSLGIACTAGD